MKGEYLDALGMFDCLQGREQVMRAQLSTGEKMESDKKELNKLKDGKMQNKYLKMKKKKSMFLPQVSQTNKKISINLLKNITKLIATQKVILFKMRNTIHQLTTK